MLIIHVNKRAKYSSLQKREQKAHSNDIDSYYRWLASAELLDFKKLAAESEKGQSSASSSSLENVFSAGVLEDAFEAEKPIIYR